ncbi:MAG: UDP-N-acetylmuramate dehydrogenase [Firmicutes bacterium]|nr:UDP-N-acetylmuramate dehydrogenase [Clostridiales bacterium]MBQ9931943.1 UDP-N-acetylmuramate dehydrogenase [Bacillota bacterium]
MTIEKLAEDLKALLPEGQVLQNVSMAEYTSFRAGGSAAVLVIPQTVEDLREALAVTWGSDHPCFIMGNGSNVLVKDGGYPGVIIHIGSAFGEITVDGEYIHAGSGALLSQIARKALEAGLTGFEFAAGIPGSIGGAVYMNAGAYGGEMAHVVEAVELVSMGGSEFMILDAPGMDFGYRRSILMEDAIGVVTSVTIKLEPGDPKEIEARMKDLTARRVSKQPLQYPSAGSFFKRPEGHFAGQLIEEAGLKGLSVNGARISPLHAGFLINEGGATAKDILDLAEVVKASVYEKSGILLEPEVRIIGADA